MNNLIDGWDENKLEMFVNGLSDLAINNLFVQKELFSTIIQNDASEGNN